MWFNDFEYLWLYVEALEIGNEVTSWLNGWWHVSKMFGKYNHES
jgi:hypothetical protein